MHKFQLIALPLFLLFGFSSPRMLNAQSAENPFNFQMNIGNPAQKGSLQKNPGGGWDVQGGGYNVWFGRDEFFYAFDTLKGDFILTANMRFKDKAGDPHKKAGWMIRTDTSENAAHISATIHGDGLTALQWRRMKGAFMRDPEDEKRAVKNNPEIIQLEKAGDVFIMRSAHFGEPLQETGRIKNKSLNKTVLAGLFVSSHNADQLATVEVWNVRIDKTVPDNYDGYRDPELKSRLEVLDVFSGKRTVIYEDAGKIEAPNWRMDKNELLFNKKGLIYSIPAGGGTPYIINTGKANQNNNDHVISMNGKELAISSHRTHAQGSGSSIYILPITGGEPELITDSTPSYLHGWHPNGRELTYTAYRPSQSKAYNVYKIDRKTKKETQLSFLAEGLADGPEYSPDGKYIYYNSTGSGTMQIWRMKTDGTENTQLTFDEYNDWFPHISPDNKYIVFLSYPTTVKPADHPAYKRVMLRMMPVNGGAPKVIAYLFGGQGTINVPSWSPDSRKIAFVTYTK